MPKDVSRLRAKVAMTIYVAPWIKRGIKTSATLSGTTASDIVERLCRVHLNKHPDIGLLVQKRG